MIGRDELEAALRANASMPTPEPDAVFVDALEQRLTVADRSNVVPITRRARRLGATAVVAATVVFAGAAAAAGVVITHPFRHDAPVEVSTTSSSASGTTSPSTTLVSAPVVVDTTVPVVVPVPTTAPISTVASPTTSRPTVPTTVAPITAAPTTAPPTTAVATTTAPTTSTTEVKVPATITLTCSADGSTVHCSWSGAPVGMDHYMVLRSQPNTGNGRAYFVAAGTTTWTDPIAMSGTTATYLVHALSAANVSLGHSNAVSVPCC